MQKAEIGRRGTVLREDNEDPNQKADSERGIDDGLVKFQVAK